MKENWNIAIIGSNVELVPYDKKFVYRYHEWMKDTYIQEMTRTEPFDDIEEEFKCCQEWYEDSNKCTFIILSKASIEIDCPTIK